MASAASASAEKPRQHTGNPIGGVSIPQFRNARRWRRVHPFLEGRQNPLAIIPVAILLGGISASGGLLQRRLGLPDASVLVLQGIIFVFVLASDALYGRIGFLKGKS